MSSNRIFTSTAPINAYCFNFDHSDNQKLLPKIPNSPFKIHLTPQSGKAVASAAFNRSENADTNTVIQSTWAAFSAMPNAERNLLLKGLIQRCSTNQVEYICTQLNLKGSEASQEGRVISLHPSEFARKAVAAGKIKKNTTKGTSKCNYDRPWVVNSKLTLNSRFDSSNEVSIDKRSNPVDQMFISDDIFGRNEKISLTNNNLYMKVYNSQFKIDSIKNHIKSAKPETSEKIMGFLSENSRKLQTIMKFLEPIAVEVDIDISLQKVMDCIAEATMAKYITMYMFDEFTEKFVVKGSNWQTVNQGYHKDDVYASADIIHHKICNVYNMEMSDDFTDSIHKVYGGLHCECILSVPIKRDNSTVVGILEVVNKTCSPPYFSSEDESLLKAISCICTLLLLNADIRSNALQRAKNIKVLLNTASLMTSDLDLEDLVRAIMQRVQKLLSAERCTVFMVDEDKQELWSSISTAIPEIRMPISSGIAGYVATTGKTCNIAQAYEDRRFNKEVDIKTGYVTRTILCMPIINSSGKVIGVTQIINKLPENTIFNAEDEALLAVFSSLAAVAIEKSVLFKTLQKSLTSVSEKRTYLARMINTMDNLILTLNAEGQLVTHNHGIDIEFKVPTSEMKIQPYTKWIGSENETLVKDIKDVYEDSGKIAYATNYELTTPAGIRLINYTIMNFARATPKSNGEVRFIKTSDEPSKEEKDPKTLENTITVDPKASDMLLDGDSPAMAKSNKLEDIKGVVIIIEEITSEKQLVNTLGRSVTPGLVKKMVQHQNLITGTSSHVVALAIDFRNFGVITESLSAGEVFTLLNQCHNIIADAILSEGGIIQAYAGDKTIGIFGAPFQNDQDVIRALNAAIHIRNGIEILNGKNAHNLSIPQLKFGIGISSGPVISGVLGSLAKQEYTCIGQCVVIAESIQKASKLYGVSLLITSETRDKIKSLFHLRELDIIYVRGHAKAITIYEVLGHISNELPRDTVTSLICFELGLAEYRQKNWQIAISHFRKSFQLCNDKPSKMFIERCKAIQDDRYEIPALGWDHGWDMD